jgi:[acyl-carrier-protein] S-malonyltransferase
MYSPVRWRKTIENIINSGFDTFIEVGPGKTLSGLLRNIDKTKTSFSVNSVETLEKTIESLLK